MDIKEKLSTYENILSFEDELKSFKTFLQGSHNPDIERLIGEYFQNWKDLFVDELIANGVNPNDRQSVIEFCEKVIAQIDSSNLVEITMAIPPNETLKQAISSWFARNFEREMVYDLQQDPSILGGILISYRGNFRDYSLRKDLREHFSKAN